MSVASMTGYARAEGRDGAGSWVWEVKSVNGKGLDVRLRLPYGLDAVEPFARDAAARRLKRGNLQVSLTLTRAVEQGAVRINRPLLAQLVAAAAEWQGSPGVEAARLDGLLAIKGVIEQDDGGADEPDEAVAAARLEALKLDLEQALDGLAAMRRAEGARIAQVLSDQLGQIDALRAAALNTAALRPEAVKERLRQQLASVLDAVPALPEERLAQELALLAVKADVREELDRLSAHIAAAREMLAEGGAIGRKLDFLSQEFNREANTLCSKSQDVDLTRIGLDLKAVIDQFREQVQNIE